MCVTVSTLSSIPEIAFLIHLVCGYFLLLIWFVWFDWSFSFKNFFLVLFQLLNFLTEFFIQILKVFLQVTDFFSPHWLTFLYESSIEFVTFFSWIEFLIVYLILWSFTHFLSRTHIFSKLSCLIIFSPVLKSCFVWGTALIFFLASLLCFKHLLEFVVCFMVYLPFFSLILFVSPLVLLSLFG